MIKITPISESAVVLHLPPPADLAQQQKLWSFSTQIESLSRISEVVVGMNNLTIFTPLGTNLAQLCTQLEQQWQHCVLTKYLGQLIDIPVSYGGKAGEDLYAVADYHNTTPEHIVQQHSETIYTVYMIGFQPGFPYLGGLPETLHTPRRAVPRTSVPAGSVGIGGSQTGVYSFTSPGGWQLIGRTELVLFDKNKMPPTLLQVGDQVRFVVKELIL